MNKKTKLKLELEAESHRERTSQDCLFCGMHFYSALSEESHRKLYPAHFKADTPPPEECEEAAAPNLKPRYKKPKDAK